MNEDDKCRGCKYRDDEIDDLRRRLQHTQEQLRHAETARDAMKSVLRIYQAHGHRPYHKCAWIDD
jgi:hypothetical protein